MVTEHINHLFNYVYEYFVLIIIVGPEIDPYWYVGRGVRPIGRFGKRYLKSRTSLHPQFSYLFEFIIKQLKKQDGLNLDNPLEEESW